ncbi:hypothetical protein PB2503_06532 [Parvularcula bermudensis HTCC2503]|uniref:Uncharacterized protein n=2 Tax=Parvularcula TaxID=208215 RepID=E0TI33_PARBH|nr:hypothetical protein PB2503_06532 [Parvularcula bermudensis HTCC2503]
MRPAPTASGEEVACLTLYPGDRSARGAGITRLGIVFAPGMVVATDSLIAKIGDDQRRAYLTPLATYQDGSVKHGALVVETAGLPPRLLSGALRRLEGTAEAPPLQIDLADAFAGVRVEATGTLGGGDHQATLLLAELIANAETQTVTPLSQDVRVRVALSPLLSLVIDARIFVDGRRELRLTFENQRTFSAYPRELHYEVAIEGWTEEPVRQRVALHPRNSAWTWALEDAPRRAAAQCPTDLMARAAFPALAPHRNPPPILGSELPSPVLPGETGSLQPSMGAGGARPDIGPVTHWTAAWLRDGQRRAPEWVIGLADLSLTIPWHFDDDPPGAPVNPQENPTFWADARGSGQGEAKFPPILFAGSSGPWDPDLAHKPSLAYPAYVLTAEPIYADALADEAAYALNGLWPEFRAPTGLSVARSLQLRTTAWGLRSLANAAFILPDTDPLKPVFAQARDTTLAELKARQVRRGILSGIVSTPSAPEPSAISPWQHDFLALVLALETRRGSSLARQLLTDMAPFLLARAAAAPETLPLRAGLRLATGPREGEIFTDWAEADRETARRFPRQTVYPENGGGQLSVLRAALIALGQVTDDERATQAAVPLGRVAGTRRLSDPDFPEGRAGMGQFTYD